MVEEDGPSVGRVADYVLAEMKSTFENILVLCC